MKKSIFFSVTIGLLMLTSCGGKTETADDAAKTEKGAEAKPGSATDGDKLSMNTNCPPWLLQYDQLAKEYKAVADKYYETGKMDDEAMDKLNEKAEAFSKDAEAAIKNGWAGYGPACAESYQKVGLDWADAAKRFQEAAMKHMGK